MALREFVAKAATGFREGAGRNLSRYYEREARRRAKDAAKYARMAINHPTGRQHYQRLANESARKARHALWSANAKKIGTPALRATVDRANLAAKIGRQAGTTALGRAGRTALIAGGLGAAGYVGYKLWNRARSERGAADYGDAGTSSEFAG